MGGWVGGWVAGWVRFLFLLCELIFGFFGVCVCVCVSVSLPGSQGALLFFFPLLFFSQRFQLCSMLMSCVPLSCVWTSKEI